MSKSSLLRWSLIANGMFSLTTGLVMALGSAQLAEYLGLPQLLTAVFGGGLVVFGLGTAYNGLRKRVDVGQARFTVIADVSWVLGAGVLLIWFPEILSAEGRQALLAVTALVAVFALLQARGIARLEGSRHIESTVDIDADPDTVWNVLSDITQWGDWNPWIFEANGIAEEGERLDLRMGEADKRAFSVTPTVTVVQRGIIFEWLGHMGVAGLFDGRHRFELEKTSQGTRLTQSETFAGILAPVVLPMVRSQTQEGFDAMNKAMKRRAEELVAANGS